MFVNGKEVTLQSAEMTLKDFLEANGYPPFIAVEKNGIVISKKSSAFESEFLRDDDVLEIVRLVGGG
jgi:thiamine biosynthesis protein ThiS